MCAFALMAVGWCMVTGDGERNHLPDRCWPHMGDDNLPRPYPFLLTDLSVQKYIYPISHSIADDPSRFCSHAFSAILPLCGGNPNACARCPEWRISTPLRRIYRGWHRYRTGRYCGGCVVGTGKVIPASGPVATLACSNLMTLLLRPVSARG